MIGSGDLSTRSESWLGLLEAVAAAQERWIASVQRGRLGPRLSEAAVRARLAAGRPLVQVEEIEGWAPHLATLAQLICAALAEQGDAAPLAAGVQRMFQSGRVSAGSLAAAALLGDGERLAAWAVEGDLDPQQLAFVAAALAGPPVRVTGEGWSAAARSLEGGLCPVCGHEPLLARLDSESGARWLICSLCGSQHRAPRVGCAFCGNSAPTTLGYLIPGEGPRGWRVGFCDLCGRYLKTVDERDSGPLAARPFVVVDAATQHLDGLAAAEGYGVQAFHAAISNKG